MDQWPFAFIHFLERPVPIFIHLAAAKHGMPPLTCRGYGIRADLTNGRLAFFILQSQWLRLRDYMGENSAVAVLLTAGTDNESYQVKGIFEQLSPISAEDQLKMEQQRKWTLAYFPSLVPLIAVSAANCVAITLRVTSIYLQTPGPDAGSLLVERSQ
ncbi:MAG: hypothetical protein ACM32O_17255 [Clostridia bacterium]